MRLFAVCGEHHQVLRESLRDWNSDGNILDSVVIFFHHVQFTKVTRFQIYKLVRVAYANQGFSLVN
jgi:hypothetical protein